MTLDQMIAFAVLGLCLVLFAHGRLRYDLVALIALVLVVLARLVPPEFALSGFGHPAVITVAAVLVISRALKNAGAIDLLAQKLSPHTSHPILHIILLTGFVALCSGFINNIGALAVMLPIALSSAAERDRQPAMILMPLAFGSILGGMMTMIGTPPNIIIASFRAEAMGTPFAMFDFAFVGVPIAIVGVLFVALIGWRLLPRERQGGTSPDQLFHIEEYITEVKVGADSPLADKRIAHFEREMGEDAIITARVEADGRLVRTRPWETVHAGDVLVLKADPADLKPLLDSLHLQLLPHSEDHAIGKNLEEMKIVEAIVNPDSPLIGRGSDFLHRRSGGTHILLAIARLGQRLHRRLHQMRIQAGDVLLMQGDAENEHDMLADLGLLPLPERGLMLGRPRKVGLALLIFGIALAAAITNILPIAVAFLAAIVGYVMTGILNLRDLYRHIDWPVIVLLGAMIPVGQALQNTGATALIAQGLIDLTQGLSPAMVLAVIMIATMFLSDIINNAATALVMAPISMTIAHKLGLSVDPFLMAVAIGASCAFLTPIGHQSNTLVMGPGGYKFWDYWRMGLPLEILIVLISIPLIQIFWPF